MNARLNMYYQEAVNAIEGVADARDTSKEDKLFALELLRERLEEAEFDVENDE